MYQLFYSPGACSLAIHVLLKELGQEVKLMKKTDVADFGAINPTQAVPALIDGDEVLLEGAAQSIHLMEKHNSPMLPKEGRARREAIQWMMFCNATLHPAYSRMFFVFKTVKDENVKAELLKAAAEQVNKYWNIVETRLEKNKFVTGDNYSMADIMLAVYANWNNFFPGHINLGLKTKEMIHQIAALPTFKEAVAAEGVKYNV
jgi:glutathione S-transferase